MQFVSFSNNGVSVMIIELLGVLVGGIYSFTRSKVPFSHQRDTDTIVGLIMLILIVMSPILGGASLK